MKYVWEDLPKPLNCFTVMNTAMVNLNTGRVIRHYSTNTKIVVVQKCVTPECTYYRTQDAAHHYLNYAFEAEAFGLPNEKAPSEPSKKSEKDAVPTLRTPSVSRTSKPIKKQTSIQKATTPKGGEEKGRLSWLKKLFRRKNG